MQETQLPGYTAFHGQQAIASGDLETVIRNAKEVVDRVEHASILIFDNATSRQVEIDFRGSLNDVLQRLAPQLGETIPQTADAEEPKAGRPKLGVVAREVTLLPRHWEWLANQPASASVTLRKLVEEARLRSLTQDKERLAQEATNRFMMVMAGNLPGFEEASRALYRKDKQKFEQTISNWPNDIRNHVNKLAADAGWEQ